MLSIARAIRSLDREPTTGTSDGFSTSLIRDDIQYPVEIDAEATRKYRKALEAVLLRMTNAPADAESSQIRSLIRGAKRDLKVESERFVAELRRELDETVVSLNEIITSFASGKEDYLVRNDLRRLTDLAKTDDIPTIRKGISEAVAILERSLDDLKHQNDLKIAELSAEIRVLHRRITTLSAPSARAGAGDVHAAVESAIAAASPFSLIVVACRNLPAIHAAYGKELATQVVRAAIQRFINQVAPDAVTGAWEEGVLASCETGVQEAQTELVRRVNSKLGGKYVFTEGARLREINLQANVEVVQGGPGEPAQQVEKRIQETLAQLTQREGYANKC